MTRLLFGLAVAAVVLTVYALVDAAFFDRSRIRGLPRFAWILIVLFVPVIGALLWLTVGRGRRGSVPRGPRTVAPDDDLEFLGKIGRDTEQELRIRKLEQELSELDGTSSAPGSAPTKSVPNKSVPNAHPVTKAPDATSGGATGNAAAGPGSNSGSGSANGTTQPGAADDAGEAPGVTGPRDA